MPSRYIKNHGGWEIKGVDLDGWRIINTLVSSLGIGR